jgi:hypothetical protein
VRDRRVDHDRGESKTCTEGVDRWARFAQRRISPNVAGAELPLGLFRGSESRSVSASVTPWGLVSRAWSPVPLTPASRNPFPARTSDHPVNRAFRTAKEPNRPRQSFVTARPFALAANDPKSVSGNVHSHFAHNALLRIDGGIRCGEPKTDTRQFSRRSRLSTPNRQEEPVGKSSIAPPAVDSQIMRGRRDDNDKSMKDEPFRPLGAFPPALGASRLAFLC